MVHDYFLLVWCCKMLWGFSYENTLFMISKKQGVFTINDVRKKIGTMCEKKVGGGGRCSDPNEYRYYFIIYIHW